MGEVSCENCSSMIPRDISIISKFLKFKVFQQLRVLKRIFDAVKILEDLNNVQLVMENIMKEATLLHEW